MHLIEPRIAVLLPCYNEALTIRELVSRFRAALPTATIYMYDNNSQDNTIGEAEKAGAVVRREILQGKGNVIRRMFSDVEADIYVMADGDLTYDPAEAPKLIAHLQKNQLDMVIGSRVSEHHNAYPAGHVLGNKLFNRIVRTIFGRGFKDVFSGYRVFTRRYVKSFPAHSMGFETETEMCIHALDARIPFDELPITYGARPQGSVSKLRTYRDGSRILWTIFLLFKEVRPLAFFMLLSSIFLIASLLAGIPVIETWLETGLVPRLPSAILATGLAVISGIFFTCGLLLDSVARNSREVKRLIYLSL